MWHKFWTNLDRRRLTCSKKEKYKRNREDKLALWMMGKFPGANRIHTTGSQSILHNKICLTLQICTSRFGWPLVYYGHAVVCLVLFLLWIYFYNDHPRDTPFVSEVELEKINRGKSLAHINMDTFVPYKVSPRSTHSKNAECPNVSYSLLFRRSWRRDWSGWFGSMRSPTSFPACFCWCISRPTLSMCSTTVWRRQASSAPFRLYRTFRWSFCSAIAAINSSEYMYVYVSICGYFEWI